MSAGPFRLASPDNPRVKDVVRLRRRGAREETGRFFVEGAREIERALAAELALETMYLEESAAKAGAAVEWEALLRSAGRPASALVLVSKPAFEKMAMREDQDGLLAVFQTPRADFAAWTLPPNPLVVVAVGLEKPGNLGALARSADAFGADGLVVAGGTDPWNPNAIRASVGSIFALRLAVVGVEALVPMLKARGLRVVAASPNGETPLPNADLGGGVALLVGSEEEGLPREVLSAADVRVAIPMRAGAADSLNVSVTAGILLYEAERRRRTGDALGR